jgi:transcriptional regulator
VYVPKYFEEERRELLHKFIGENPFGLLVSQSGGVLEANHLPFEFDPAAGGQGALRAHVARKNAVWQGMSEGQEVLVVFTAAHAYISPNWYPSKHEKHEQVPTWNYRVVHATGRVRVKDDATFVAGVVARLTRRFEQNEATPWRMSDAPREYLDKMLEAIVGIEIDVMRLVGKFKLSQNKDDRDRGSVAATLIRRGDTELGSAMLLDVP